MLWMGLTASFISRASWWVLGRAASRMGLPLMSLGRSHLPALCGGGRPHRAQTWDGGGAAALASPPPKIHDTNRDKTLGLGLFGHSPVECDESPQVAHLINSSTICSPTHPRSDG